MKELSIEEKAKRYDESLERMKSWVKGEHPECFSEAQKTAEFIFPELKESEDERIRKDLLEHCKNCLEPYILTGNKCPEIQSWINWLEKQKPTDNIEPRYSIGDVLCDKSCTSLNKNSQPNIEIRDIRNGLYICNNCTFPISQQDEYELVAKRIEPQPAWSEEDENMLYDAIGAIGAADYYTYDDKVKIEKWLIEQSKKLKKLKIQLNQ